MGRVFRITEEQYKNALAEGVTIAANVGANNNDMKAAVDNAIEQGEKNGLSRDDITVGVPGNYNNEGKLYTKAQLQEAYRKKLKENSEVYTIGDFFKIFKR